MLALAALALLRLPAFVAAAPPVVDSFTASSSTVAPADLVTLIVEAHDPDCPGTCTTGCGLTLRSDFTAWSATGGAFETTDNGTTGSPYTASASWRAPEAEGIFTLSVSLSDSGTSLCGGRQTTIATVEVQVTTLAGSPPVIDSLVADPSRVFPGDISQLLCAASDLDGDPVTYSWSSDLGAVEPGTNGVASFSSAKPGIATVTCTATDAVGLIGSASITVAVTGAVADTTLSSGLVSPQRLSVDSQGNVFVVEDDALLVLHLGSGELAYSLPIPGVTSVEVDWNDHLLVGRSGGAQVLDRRGNVLLTLQTNGLFPVADVAVAGTNPRYALLREAAGQVLLFDSAGLSLGAFGSPGDAPAQLNNPLGIAATPAGTWIVADYGHGLIKEFDDAGTLLRSFAGRGGALGEFVALNDIAVDDDGLIYASDAFQDWIQVFASDGTLREVLGSYGSEPGELMTATGIAVVPALDRLLAASSNGSSIQVFVTSSAPPAPDLPDGSATPVSLSFAPQPVGVESLAQPITLTNNGQAPLGIRQLSAPAEFPASHDCGLFVEAGASCAVSVSFQPAADGLRSGQLQIDTSEAGGTHQISLSGLGFRPPKLSLSSPLLRFPDQAVGTVSESKDLVLTNLGGVDLVFGQITAGPEFGRVSACGGALGAGQSCSVSVYFSPTIAADDVTSQLTITSNDPSGPHQVGLRGRAIRLEVRADPTRLLFAQTPPDSDGPIRMASVANTGTESVRFVSSYLGGDQPTEFRVESDGCAGNRLLPGQECVIAVRFRPTAFGVRTALLLVPTLSDLGPAVVELVGGTEVLFADGFESGDIGRWSVAQPEAVAFGQLSPGALEVREVEIRNGREQVAIGSLAIVGRHASAFQIETDGCSGRKLARREACRVTLRFSPVAAGPQHGVLRVPETGRAQRTREILLLGEGVSGEAPERRRRR